MTPTPTTPLRTKTRFSDLVVNTMLVFASLASDVQDPPEARFVTEPVRVELVVRNGAASAGEGNDV